MYLYVKTFENNKMYVGITNNIERRNKEHEYWAENNSHLLVHKAMRKYKHTTEVWCDKIYDWELMCELEKQTIQQLRELGYELYNMTDGGDGTLGLKGKKGKEHPKAKPKEYYKTNSTTRYDFKRICKKQGWDFKHFKEVDSEEKRGCHKKYYYIYIGENNKDYGVQTNDYRYYEIKSSIRGSFKRACKNNNWEFDNFEEIKSGEKSGRDNKYFYIYKKEVG